MSEAGTLHRAASLMRGRAVAASRPPWQAWRSWAGPNAVVNADGHPVAVCGDDYPEAGYLKASADRAHIAGMDPLVAVEVADLLDSIATDTGLLLDSGIGARALAVAGAFLRDAGEVSH